MISEVTRGACSVISEVTRGAYSVISEVTRGACSVISEVTRGACSVMSGTVFFPLEGVCASSDVLPATLGNWR